MSERPYDLQAQIEADATYERHVDTSDLGAAKDSMAVATHDDVSLSLSFEIDEAFVEACIFVKYGGDGADIYQRDVATFVTDMTAEGYDAIADTIDLTLNGTVDAWTTMAVRLADDEMTVGNDDDVAENAVTILTDLAQYSVDSNPLLGAYQLVSDYDTAYDRATVLERLTDHDGIDASEVIETATATADD